jgi:hypothetical protein
LIKKGVGGHFVKYVLFTSAKMDEAMVRPFGQPAFAIFCFPSRSAMFVDWVRIPPLPPYIVYYQQYMNISHQPLPEIIFPGAGQKSNRKKGGL